MAIIVENIKVHGIPILTVYTEDAQKCPVVFFVHGLGSNKEKDLNIAYELAVRGIVCINVDARHHGERNSSEFADDDDEIKAKLFFDIVTKTGDDILNLINHFSNDGRVDITRIGIAGLSMGGFITYYVLTRENRIKAAAPLIGSPAWRDFVQFNSSSIHNFDMEPIIGLVDKVDPIRNYEKIYPSALLMQNGKIDSLIPYQGAEKLYTLLTPLYEGIEDKLNFHLYEKIGHDVTEIMRQKLYAFFVKHL